MKKRPDGAKGYLEGPDPYRTKTRDGKTILCFACGLGPSALKRLQIIGCDACDAHFHLECLNPPLVTLSSFPSKWVCPLHMVKTLPCRQAAKESNTIPINTLNTPNDGDIDVVVTPHNRTKAKPVEEIIINRVKYQVPENIIILDFWAKLSKDQEVSKTASQDPPLTRDGLLPTPTHQASTSASASPKDTSLAPATNTSREDVESHPSSTDSHVPLASLPPPPRPSTSTALPTARSDLSCLLQAAQQVNQAQTSQQPTEGLALLGNAASLQSPVTSTLRRIHRKKTNGLPPRTRTRGSARLSKSAPAPSEPPAEIPEIETAQRLHTPENQLEAKLKTSLPRSSNHSTDVAAAPPSNDTPAATTTNLPATLQTSEGTKPPLGRKRKKRSTASTPSSTVPTDQLATETSSSTVQTVNSNAAHPPLPVINGAPSAKTPKIVQSANPDNTRSHLPTTSSIAGSDSIASKAPITDSTNTPFTPQGSKHQSTRSDSASGVGLDKQNQSGEQLTSKGTTEGEQPISARTSQPAVASGEPSSSRTSHPAGIPVEPNTSRTSQPAGVPVERSSSRTSQPSVVSGEPRSSRKSQPAALSTSSPSNNLQFPSVPPMASTSTPALTPSTTRPHASQATIDDPNPHSHYSPEFTRPNSQQTANFTFKGGTTAPSIAKTSPFESSNSGTSNHQQRTPSAQLPQFPRPKECALTSTVPHVSPVPKQKEPVPSETGSVTRPPRKRARQNNHDPLSHSSSSPQISKTAESQSVTPNLSTASQPFPNTSSISYSSSMKTAESQTIAPNVHTVSQPFPSTSNISQSSSMKTTESQTATPNVLAGPQPFPSISRSSIKGADLSSGKATVTRGDVPGRTTINRGQKPGKAQMNKMVTPSLASPASGLKATASGSASVVQMKHRDPAIADPHHMSASASGSMHLPGSTASQETTKNSPPVNGSVYDKAKSAERHVAPHLLSQCAQQPVRLSNDAGSPSCNTSLSSSTSTTKMKRKKSAKNPSPPSHLVSNDQRRTAEKGQHDGLEKSTSAVPQDTSPEATRAIPLDPRLSAPVANYEIPTTSNPPSRPGDSMDSTATLSAKISIALAKFENEQSKLSVSPVAAKPPPRKKVKRKSAPATGGTFPSTDAHPMARGTPPIGSSVSSLGQSIQRPVTATFVPHPQNPLTLVPQPQRVATSMAQPHTFAFVPHPQHGPTVFSGSEHHQLSYVPHPQYPAGTALKSSSPSLVLGSRNHSREGSSTQNQPRRGSLTVHGSSPPLLPSAGSPTVVSRPSSAVGNPPMTNPRDNNVFIPLPLTKPVKTTPDPSSWK
ncbi:hypothetical protein PGT21_030393 [Puccinia graminis f. sp. tritici]|uniref:PHD-type domain-containing protein n=1 Tax=Puccinia graminis f. sp. tritici TaxID=56615 RepID=A0A5B0Q713_PUCGR|nr:hypothetical protein PGT21_030393 [Puccinia graminis f. sp. tritici]